MAVIRALIQWCRFRFYMNVRFMNIQFSWKMMPCPIQFLWFINFIKTVFIETNHTNIFNRFMRKSRFLIYLDIYPYTFLSTPPFFLRLYAGDFKQTADDAQCNAAYHERTDAWQLFSLALAQPSTGSHQRPRSRHLSWYLMSTPTSNFAFYGRIDAWLLLVPALKTGKQS